MYLVAVVAALAGLAAAVALPAGRALWARSNAVAQSPTGTPDDYGTTGWLVTGESRINVRACPATDCQVIGGADPGARLAVIKTESGWHQIRLADGRVGYVAAWLTRVKEFEPFPLPDTTWVQTPTLTLYVDNQHPQAADENPGTDPAYPLRTVGRAAELAVASGAAVRIAIAPGTYRETLTLPREGEAPIVFEATHPGRTVISGSDVWDDWQPVAGTPLLVHDWPFDWGAADNPFADAGQTFTELGRRREMFFVDGLWLEPVLTYAESMEPGRFYVDEAADRVYMSPPPDTDMQRATVEVAVRETLLDAPRPYVALVGLVFQHASSSICRSKDAQGACHEGKAVRLGPHSVIENSTFQWNNWHTCQLSSDSVVRDSRFNHNGGNGLYGSRLRHVVLENNETSYNNWRGALGEFYGWTVGQKFFRVRGVVVRGHRAVDNQSPGIWFDWDNANVLIEESTFCGNLGAGIFLEASQGPFTVRNNVICETRLAPGTRPEINGGILLSDVSAVALTGNHVYDNAGAQITIVSWTRDVTDTYDSTVLRQLHADYHSYTYNHIVCAAGDQRTISFWGSDDTFALFRSTLVSNRNIWFNPLNPRAFYYQSDFNTFAEWQADLAVDQESQFADPGAADLPG